MNILAATDGSARANPYGAAAWAWWVSGNCWATGGIEVGSNNQAELTAVLKLLQASEAVRAQKLHILCDSQYVIKALTVWSLGWEKNGWRTSSGKSVANQDIIQPILRQLQSRIVTFEWVRGHDGHVMNEQVDKIAQETAVAVQRKKTYYEGPGWNAVPTITVSDAVRFGRSGA